MWTAFKLIALAGLCYAAIVAWVYGSQRRLLYYPTHSEVGTPTDVGLAHEDVMMTNGLGTRIHGWWLPCADARFTLLFSHGNGGNVSHRLESLRIFHDLGLSVLIYDYSGYGRSEGEPGEAATRADAMAAWQWLVDERGVAPGSIILFGRSLGGAVAAGLAADLKSVNITPAGLILESTFTSVPDMGAHRYPWLPVRRLARYSYDARTALADIRLPALFLHSLTDDVVPFALGRRLFETYGGPKRFMELTGDHNSGFLETGPAYPAALDEYLRSLESTPRS